MNNKRPLEEHVRLFQRYGYGYTITIPGLGRIIDISRPDWIEHVQKTRFQDYVKGKRFRDKTFDMLGNGIFAADSHEWFIQRKVSSRIFTARTFDGMISRTVSEGCGHLQSLLSEHADKPGDSFGIHEIFEDLAMDTFFRVAFNEPVDSLRSSHRLGPSGSSQAEQYKDFSKAFGTAIKVLDMRFVNPCWRMGERFSKSGKEIKDALKVIHGFAGEIISRKAASFRQHSPDSKVFEGGDESTDLLSLFMKHSVATGKSIEDKDLSCFVLNLLIAGRDTTAEACTWMTWRLLADQQDRRRRNEPPSSCLWERLRVELDGLDDYVRRGGNQVKASFDQGRLMPLMYATFHETLRLHPSIPKNIRRATCKDILPNGGPLIEEGDFVLWSDWAMGRNPTLWGADADLFRPERWIDESGSIRRESVYKAHFFSAGPRVCLGQKMAIFEGLQIMKAIIQNFDMELDMSKKYSSDDPASPPPYVNALTLPMKGGLYVRCRKRGGPDRLD
ncbi:cytochrome P450 [Violaceomyces palustris]|uniref:Cytochrome P450 n=1 Tax=Violaceomyces palustris TaxID=1673888 RepID=A0ACD0P7N8_9BASI|nr:cytochrome P450 [Violaceomyces palustris]